MPLPTPESDHRHGLHNGAPYSLCRLCAPAHRTALVHLNVEIPGTDTRTAGEVAEALLAAVEVGSDDDSVRSLTVDVALAEEL